MTESNFTTRGDEPVEARIVSWVLGEASAFEVDELERLCEERPELAVFKRRMEAVHGLVAEGSTSKGDANWKLSSKKRSAIEELIGAEEEFAADRARDQRIGQSGRRALLAIAACLVLTVVVSGLVTPVLLGQKKKSEQASSDDVEFLNLFESEGNEMDGLLLSREAPALTLETGSRRKFKEDLKDSKQNSLNQNGLAVPSAKIAMPDSSVVDETASSFGVDAGVDSDFSGNYSFAAGESKSLAGSRRTSKPTAQTAVPAAPSREVSKNEPSYEDYAAPGKKAKVDTFYLSEAEDLGGGAGGQGQGKGLAALNPPPAPAGEPAPAALRFAEGEEAAGLSVVPGSVRGNKSLNERDSSEANVKYRQGNVGDDLGTTFDKSKALPASDSGEFAGRSRGESAKILGGLHDETRANEDIPVDRADVIDSLHANQFNNTASMTNTELESLKKQAVSGKDINKMLLYKLGAETELELPSESQQKLLEEVALEKKAEDKEADKDERKRPIVSDEETIAAEEPYSTFSLNINDASFRVAQAALARGEMPDPSGIKVEQFYNAVDYGDPSPAAGQPVASKIEQSAHPVIPGRNLVRVAIKTASEGRNQGQPLRLTLLIDQSGSMAREDRRQAMVDALGGLRGLLGEQDQVNVIGFARTPRLLAEAVNGKEGQLANLVNIEANEGGTNLEQALKLGEQLAERHQLEGAQNRLVLFTDGAANLGDADPDSLAEKIKDLRQKGIAFDIAGIVADGLNDELLGEMARHGNGRYYVVGKGGKDRFAEQLAGAFRPAAENVKVQVHFNPERVGRYKLIGFEKDRLNKEDFHDDTVDAAEMAAEEAGVAIYQVETLPEGEGEIGEVSVRFRDVASGKMVERSWTIANEIATPAIDQARPSMQLATLAMLAGEKLRGGPLADAINFNEMTEVIAKVNQHYKGDPKAAEMLQMVEQLK